MQKVQYKSFAEFRQIGLIASAPNQLSPGHWGLKLGRGAHWLQGDPVREILLLTADPTTVRDDHLTELFQRECFGWYYWLTLKGFEGEQGLLIAELVSCRALH